MLICGCVKQTQTECVSIVLKSTVCLSSIQTGIVFFSMNIRANKATGERERKCESGRTGM